MNKISKNLKKELILLALLVGSLIIIGNFSSTSKNLADANRYIKSGLENITINYDIKAAQNSFEMALSVDPKNKIALYSLARIYGLTGEYAKAFSVIEDYKLAYPDEKRIYYVAGLAYAFDGNLYQAEIEFQNFVDFGISSWAGYLDLAWVHFRQGDFDRAQARLEEAIALFGDNVWLNTSLGAAYIAQGENELAEEVLTTASEQLNELTKEEWANNYSFNNPENFEAEMAQMRDVVELNLSIAMESKNTIGVAKALSSSFIGVSPQGYTKGIAVAACGESDSCSTVTCFSGQNACGNVEVGSYQSCTISGDSACSASVPSNPSGYGNTCFKTNSCGNTSSGTIGCDGLCGATPPGTSCDTFAPSISSGVCTVGVLRAFNITAIDPEGDNIQFAIDWNNDGQTDQLAPTEGYSASGSVQTVGNTFSTAGVKTIRVRTEDEGGAVSQFISHTFVCSEGDKSALLSGEDGSGDGGGGGSVDGALVADPLLVRSGNNTTLIWATEGVDSCTVTGTNGDSFTGTSATRSSSAVTSATTFTLSCDGGAVTDSVLVNVVPVFQEI
jgi:tetratricopeptide (TPR) repeat protein